MQKALSGPKHSLTFRNNYPAVVQSVAALLFFLFISTASFGQGAAPPGYAPKVQSYGNWYNRLRADSAQHIPNKACLCKNDNDTTPQLFIFRDTLRGFWNGAFHNIGFGGGSGGIDTIFVTQIGTGSPQIPLVYAVDGNLRVVRLVPGVFTTPFMNADSAAGINIDTTGSGGVAYKAWIIAQYGPPGSGFKFATLGDSVATADRYFGLHGFNFYIHSVYPAGAPNHILLENLEGPGGNGGVSQLDLQDNASLYAGSTVTGGSSQILLTYLREFHNQSQGDYEWTNLVQVNDSTTYKPLAANSSGLMKRMDGWPGGGGGGASDVVTTYTSGATLTQGSGANYIQVNPASIQSVLAITTLASGGTWHSSNDLYIIAGGTVTSGNPVITTLTITAGSGLTLVQAIVPTTINAGEVIRYHKVGTLLYRIN